MLGGTVEGLRRLSGGASRETWAFDLGAAPLILRRGINRVEGAVLAAAAAAGVPVPATVRASNDPDELGAAYAVMERLDGETIPRKLLRDDAYAGARAGLARRCGEVLGALHAVPADSVPGLESPNPLAQWRATLDNLGDQHPTFELAFRWLAANAPPVPEGGARVVHGDFRNGNLLVGEAGLVAVLDWELAHGGDPVEDLGWLCAPPWRFGVDRVVGGFGDVDDLLAGYEAAGGAAVAPAHLQWWIVMGTLKWGIMCILQSRAHLSGAVRSVELAAIGRRVCETEWDLLGLLGLLGLPGLLGLLDEPEPVAGITDPPSATPPPNLHGRPTSAELVEAVREFVERDVMANTEGRVQFHTRVTANVLGMVERELRLGDAQVARQRQLLDALGMADEAALAAAIRAGTVDEEAANVRAAVVDAVRSRLEVANPRYGR